MKVDLSSSRVEVVAKGPNGRPYTVVEVPSERDPSKVYRVDLVNVRCSCPGWIFSRGGRKLCKHLRALGFSEALVPVAKTPAPSPYVELL